jgi:hypothetical protein
MLFASYFEDRRRRRMFPQLNAIHAQVKQDELASAAARHSRFRRHRERAPWDESQLWQGLTVRLATSADQPALARLAELEEAVEPAAPVLLGVVMQRPVAALSLRDGSVIADPFTPTRDLVELMSLRARQLGCC